jgi:hypothetical protein
MASAYANSDLLLVGGNYNKRAILEGPGYLNAPFEGYILGVRDVYQISPSHYLVKITEAYPVVGRTWYNFYNVSIWSGWKSVTPV